VLNCLRQRMISEESVGPATNHYNLGEPGIEGLEQLG
jgi:hypothetical protein